MNSGFINGTAVSGGRRDGFGIGGIVGINGSALTHCINIGTVKGYYLVGGIAGSVVDGNGNNGNFIENCINSGLIIGDDRVGGILGYISLGRISNCINTGTVTGNTKTGCIVGENENGTIENCYYDKQTCSGEK